MGAYVGSLLPNKFAIQLAGQTISGAISGGIAAEIYGADFMDGFISGGEMAAMGFFCNQVADAADQRVAEVASRIFGETASIRPGESTAAELSAAREDVAQVYLHGNTSMRSALPTNNTIEMTQWNLCIDAARNAINAPWDSNYQGRYMNMRPGSMTNATTAPNTRSFGGAPVLNAHGPFNINPAIKYSQIKLFMI